MTRTSLTRRRLEAMDAAVSAMLAGEQGEGDWPEDVSRKDLEDAQSWIDEQIAKRPSKRSFSMKHEPKKLVELDCDDCELPQEICACEEASAYNAAYPLIEASSKEE